MQKLEWIICPKCGNKTRLKMRSDTILKNFPLYCPKCKQECLKVESYSISNQRELINMYLKGEADIIIVDYYIDDGYSGTDFNRPDFKRMLNDIKDGKVNAVIVKDLSRLGRNYIEVGNNLEQIFPLYNIRFIAINDNIDSFKDPRSVNNVIVPFKNLMNDEYCRDISNKVKSVINAKKRNGQFCAGIAPYGYVKDPENKHHLIIDEESAKVVKMIFQMAMEGKGKITIAKTLNSMGIYSPNDYKRLVLNIKCGNAVSNKDSVKLIGWNAGQINHILKNEVYCGDMIQCKYKTVSYKIHKLVATDKDDWIIVRGTHEAIISREDFDKVNVISQTEYFDYVEEYDKDIKTLQDNLLELKEKVSLYSEDNANDDKKWIEVFRSKQNIEELTRDTLMDLIDVIHIHEGSKITITFKYEDEYNQALEFVKENVKYLIGNEKIQSNNSILEYIKEKFCGVNNLCVNA